MTSILYNEIPSLDLKDFTNGSPQKKQEFVNQLGEAYENIGFVAIKNHGLTDSFCKDLYDSVKSFFSLSDQEKFQYSKPELNGQRGYVGKGKEKAQGRSIGDLKEFYHVGQIKEKNNPLTEEYPDNIWPQEALDFEKNSTKAFQTLESTGTTMLQAIALHLGLDENFFAKKVEKGNSILRAIHYFPIEDPELLKAGAVRAAEHGDINLITLLMGASAEGLEVLRRDNKWIPITALPDQIIVNVGDMLARLTNNKLKSTIHRVINPRTEKLSSSRFSIPFFMHPRLEMDLNCLENCIDENNPKAFDDISAGDFLYQRLVEIGLVKK